MKLNSPEDAEVLIQRLPSDMGIHRNPRKGTLNGPENILERIEFERPVFVDEVFPDEFDLEETHARIESNTEELAEYGRPVVSIGGDHSVSYPVLKALKRSNPDMQLVWLDAHLDVKRPVDGNVSHDVVVRQLVEEDVFRPEEVFFMGVTEIDHDEEEFLEKHEFNVYRSGELSLFLKEFDYSRPCYLSVDIDVLKEGLAPGTGYPDGQMSLEDVEKVINELRPVHSDLVEVAPSLDEDMKTVECGKKILESLISSHPREQ